jgi:two-component system, chemotaxis family, chemotaxis protein CheY
VSAQGGLGACLSVVCNRASWRVRVSCTGLGREMTAVTKADFSPLTILVIDDSPFMQMLLAEMLLSFGVGKVLTAAGAEEAFQRMQMRSPDVIFCDWQMYPVDGLAMLRRLRQMTQSGLAYIPFVMVTGHNANEDVTLALGEGADSYIVKPFSCETLMNHLIKVIVQDKGHLTSAGSKPKEMWAVE